jgi:hypothetical protein
MAVESGKQAGAWREPHLRLRIAGYVAKWLDLKFWVVPPMCNL